MATGSLSSTEARRLLNLDPDEPLCKTQIQSAFVRAAQTYHPDSRHRPGARPCAITFRKCDAARQLLLANRYLASRRRNRGGVGAQGFPYRKSRIITMKQNLMLRGLLMGTIVFGVFFDQWTRVKHQHKHEKHKRK